VLAGYAGNNKYSLMGGLRASAQLISYELAMGMSVGCMVLATGSLRMTDMVKAQEEALWGVVPALQNWYAFTPFGFVSMVIFLICMVAETNRAPFDLPEAENELIAGYHTEYSSMKFAVFFMGEYAAMFVFSGVLSVVFLGGYNAVPIRWDWIAANVPALSSVASAFQTLNVWLAPVWFLGKCTFFLSVYIWLRATLPRLRYDQLMSLGWKSLLPAALANFIVVMIWIYCTRLYGPVGGWASVAVAAVVIAAIIQAVKRNTSNPVFEDRTVTLVDPAKAAN
jgi:NADH-quinone oxidoreductase subunit H